MGIYKEKKKHMQARSYSCMECHQSTVTIEIYLISNLNRVHQQDRYSLHLARVCITYSQKWRHFTTNQSWKHFHQYGSHNLSTLWHPLSFLIFPNISKVYLLKNGLKRVPHFCGFGSVPAYYQMYPNWHTPWWDSQLLAFVQSRNCLYHWVGRDSLLTITVSLPAYLQAQYAPLFRSMVDFCSG